MGKWPSLLQSAFLTTVATVALIGHGQAKFHILPNGGEIKAVLIAGSGGWINYRHQASVCHVYQILRGNGVPEENIIAMIYDDIAFHKKNPNKGVIINRPGSPNVYKNVKKDYTGEDVNKKVFFDVLLGNKEAVKGIGSERVLESGPNDHVFVHFAGHGASGLISMPFPPYIRSSELLEVLEKMAKTSRFNKMFFFISACKSGSIPSLIPKNLNIFAMTSANATEASQSCEIDLTLQTPLGSVFDDMWMRLAETADLTKETVQQGFEKVRAETNTSHVSEYGDLDLGSTKLSEVFGHRDHPMPFYDTHCFDPLPQHQVPVVILEQRIQDAVVQEEKKKLEKKLQHLHQARKEVVQFFLKLAEELIKPTSKALYEDTISNKSELTKTNLACYENAYTHLDDNCFKISNDPFVGTQLYILINLCNVVPEAQLVEKIKSMCHKKPVL